MSADNKKLIESYYDSFHSRNIEQFLELLSDDVLHDINQGDRQIGRDAFRVFLEHMNRCYRERLTNLVIMTSGNRAAAEFMVEGTYLTTDPGLPEAKGQRYRLPAGAFFEIEAGQITRISNYYNLTDWIAQVSES